MKDLLEYWPIIVAGASIVIALAKMHNDIDNLKNKVKTLFELHNRKD